MICVKGVRIDIAVSSATLQNLDLGRNKTHRILSVPVSEYHFESSNLLFDLKRCGKLMQGLSHQHTVKKIATTVTDGLVEQFGCLFARLWITTSDRTALNLVASSGLYTHIDGSFASVPMGAYKLGTTAEHRIPFLSNCLAEETWVKDRDWVIANHIQGFAGLPLVLQDQALGVLAVFSEAPLSAEFLEVLQLLSVAVTGAITTAQTYQEALQIRKKNTVLPPTLSEHLSQEMGHNELSLIGLEQPVSLAVHQLMVEAARQVQVIEGHYCRLIYEPDQINFEVIFPVTTGRLRGPEAHFDGLAQKIEQLQGHLKTETDGKIVKSRIQFPLAGPNSERSELSGREQEILELLACGCRDRNISEQLYISERTVKFHVKNILAKLQVRTRVQAVFIATKKGWLA